MRKLLSLLLILLLVITMASCSEEISYKRDNDSDDGKYSKSGYSDGDEVSDINEHGDGGKAPDIKYTASTPKTIMDAFDGERRLWYRLKGDDYNNYNVRYDSDIIAVYVTENKKVTEVYYRNWGSNEFNPAYGRTYIQLGELDGLTDDEILEMFREEYADGTKEYTIEDEGYTHTTEKVSLPRKIKYNGQTDNSGNKLIYEEIILLREELGNYDGYELAKYRCFKYLSPKTVKSMEFVGFGEENIPNFLITMNTFDSFEPEFDDPDGARKLY